MSSNSEKPNKLQPKTLEQLLSLKSDLLRLRDLHRSSLWESLRDLLLAERLFHLDQLAETDDERISLEHKVLARWLKHFIEDIPYEVGERLKAEEREASGIDEKFDPSEGGTAYMESDGHTPELEN